MIDTGNTAGGVGWGRGIRATQLISHPPVFPSMIHPSAQSFSSNATLIMLPFGFKRSRARVRAHAHTPQVEKLPSAYRSKVLRVHSILLDWTLINFSYYTCCSSAPNHGSGCAFDQDIPSTRDVLFPTCLPNEILPFLQPATLMSSMKSSMTTSPLQS